MPFLFFSFFFLFFKRKQRPFFLPLIRLVLFDYFIRLIRRTFWLRIRRCTVVLFNPRRNTQAHVLNACRKTVTSLALAGDGRLLATGECGHMPNVRVWDISDPHNAVQIAEFSGHKYGINCVVSKNQSRIIPTRINYYYYYYYNLRRIIISFLISFYLLISFFSHAQRKKKLSRFILSDCNFNEHNKFYWDSSFLVFLSFFFYYLYILFANSIIRLLKGINKRINRIINRK